MKKLLTLCVFLFLQGSAAADGLKDALAIQKAFREIIETTEPSIGCILVSRSDAYVRLLKDEVDEDHPGRLGDFNRDRAARILGLKRQNDALEELQKLDLADVKHVPEAFGSGVVIDESGLILTNFHVVKDATKLYVRLPGQRDGSYADIHAADPRSDLAVLKLQHRLKCSAIKRGDAAKAKKGDIILTLANPFAAGFDDGSPSASWGIISNLRRRAPDRPALTENERAKLTLHHYDTLIQTDVRLNLGCSGGALLNLQGELIGLTNSLAAITGGETPGGFAIPMTEPLWRIIDVLKSGREVEYGFLGVGMRREGKEVRLTSVLRGSPAELAGLRDGDAILKVNDVALHETDDLFLALGMCLAGSEAKIEYRRENNRTNTTKAVLTKFWLPAKKIASKKPAAINGIRVDHGAILAQRDPFNRNLVPKGVIVSEVLSSAPEETKRLLNVLVTAVNGKIVRTPDEFHDAASGALHSGKAIMLTLDGQKEKVELKAMK